jgi:ribosome-binding factor A
MGEPGEQAETIKALKHAAGFLRHELPSVSRYATCQR